MIFHKKLFYNLFNVTKFKDTLYKLLITITVNDIISLDESMCTILHGYAIIQFVEEVTNGRVLLGAGTLYGALSSLEQKGWIKLQSTESTSRKKVYLITPSGKEAVQTEIDRLHQLIDLAERISKEI